MISYKIKGSSSTQPLSQDQGEDLEMTQPAAATNATPVLLNVSLLERSKEAFFNIDQCW